MIVGNTIDVRAEITGDSAFNDLAWQVAYSEEIVNDTGVVQSVCATDKYIVIIENTADDPDQKDTVSAYYRYDKDENGNPVEQYSLAKRVQESDWEHGNGMTYNPKTNEIYVALYTNFVEENEGSLYVMDADTLEYKRTIHVEKGYNILGIDYVEDKDEYVIQTNVSDNYSIKILNSNFEVKEDLGPVDTAPGINYQDLCVSGDYVILSPLSGTGDSTDYINVYSLSRREVILTEVLEPDVETGAGTELESITNLGNGEFLIIENVRESSGYRYFQFYTTKVPYYFTISTDSRHGDVSGSSDKVLRGDSYTVNFSAEEGYEVGSLAVDGKDIDPENYQDGYTFEDVQQDHEFVLKCTPVLVTETKIKEASNSKTGFLPFVVLLLLPMMGVSFSFYLNKVKLQRKAVRIRSRGYRKAISRKLADEYPDLGYVKKAGKRPQEPKVRKDAGVWKPAALGTAPEGASFAEKWKHAARAAIRKLPRIRFAGAADHLKKILSIAVEKVMVIVAVFRKWLEEKNAVRQKKKERREAWKRKSAELQASRRRREAMEALERERSGVEMNERRGTSAASGAKRRTASEAAEPKRRTASAAAKVKRRSAAAEPKRRTAGAGSAEPKHRSTSAAVSGSKRRSTSQKAEPKRRTASTTAEMKHRSAAAEPKRRTASAAAEPKRRTASAAAEPKRRTASTAAEMKHRSAAAEANRRTAGTGSAEPKHRNTSAAASGAKRRSTSKEANPKSGNKTVRQAGPMHAGKDHNAGWPELNVKQRKNHQK